MIEDLLYLWLASTTFGIIGSAIVGGAAFLAWYVQRNR